MRLLEKQTDEFLEDEFEKRIGVEESFGLSTNGGQENKLIQGFSGKSTGM